MRARAMLQTQLAHDTQDELQGKAYPVVLGTAGETHVLLRDQVLCGQAGANDSTTTSLPDLQDTRPELCSACESKLTELEWELPTSYQDDGWRALHHVATALAIRERAERTLKDLPHILNGEQGGTAYPRTLTELTEILEHLDNIDTEMSGRAGTQTTLAHLEVTKNMVEDAYKEDIVKDHLRAEVRDGPRSDMPYLVVWHQRRALLLNLGMYVDVIRDILLAWDARSGHDEESTWVVVPEDVAQWLRKQGQHRQDSQTQVVPLPENLETVLGLWAPGDTTGDLKSIHAAIEAARRIHGQ